MLGLTEARERQLRAEALLALDDWAPIGRDIRVVLTRWSLDAGCHDETAEWMDTLEWRSGPRKDTAIRAVIEWAVVHFLRQGQLALLLSDAHPQVREATIIALGSYPPEHPERPSTPPRPVRSAPRAGSNG